MAGIVERIGAGFATIEERTRALTNARLTRLTGPANVAAGATVGRVEVEVDAIAVSAACQSVLAFFLAVVAKAHQVGAAVLAAGTAIVVIGAQVDAQSVTKRRSRRALARA
jgi:hypothetical protein